MRERFHMPVKGMSFEIIERAERRTYDSSTKSSASNASVESLEPFPELRLVI
jgi:hypothetical protein